MKFSFKIFSNKGSLATLFSKGGTGYVMNPVRDWTIGLMVATICFLVGVAFISYDFYTQISQDPKKDLVVESKPLVYKEKEVIRYAGLYAEKASTFNKLREVKHVPISETVDDSKHEEKIKEPTPLAEPAEEQYTDPVPTLAQ